MTDALIIGGGIAGTATAMALHKAGFQVAVYEAYPTGGDDAGAFLTVGANGMFALAQIDATEPVTGAGFPLTTLRLTDENGQTIATRPLDRWPGADVPGHHHLRRAELYRVLQAEARRRGIPIRHGKRLTGVDGRRAHFADGTTAEAELLIGADGLRSTVRGLIDPAVAAPRYAGQRVFYGYTTKAAPPADPDTMHMVRGRQAAFGYTVSPGGETWWFARVPAAELSRDSIAETTPERWRAQLVELFRADSTPAEEIIRATGTELLADNIYDLPGVSTWHTGSMLILGDAAHAASPAAGQGASMALEDAVMLGKCLRDLPKRTEALAAYERLRRARVDRVIAGSAALTRSKMPNPMQRAIRNFRSRRQYARPDPAARDWLYDYPLAWNTTITVELATRTATAQLP